MLSRFLVNLLLLLIIIVLLVVLFHNDGNDNVSARKLTGLSADAVNLISISHRDRTIKIEKHGGHWRITTPVVVAANDFRIGTLLGLLDTTSHARYMAASLDLGKYGLQQPLTRVRFNDTEIAFGIVNPINNYRYVRTGETVHLVDDLYYPLISSQIGTLVSLKPLDADSKIVKLVLPDDTVLSRDVNGNWQSNIDLAADDITATIANWKNTQAFGVHDYLERDELGRVEIYLDGINTPITLLITDTDPWLIIARPELGLEYHYDLDAYDALLRPGAPDELPAELQQDNNEQTLKVPADEFLQQLSQ